MIILLNGSINAGKTTVGRQLAAQVANGAHVDVDDIVGSLPGVPLAESIPIHLESAASVTSNLVERGFDVIVTYPLSDSDFEYLTASLSTLDTDIYAVTLSPPLDVVLTNRGRRELDEWERARIREMYDMDIHRPAFGVCIDNEAQSPSETVTEIRRRIRDGTIEPAVGAAETVESTTYSNEWTN